jgi:lipopolysaccharide assembly protein A
MVLYVIIGMVLGALGVNFALQNTQLVTLTFFVWQYTGPLAVIIFGSMLAGISVAMLALIPSVLREQLDAYAARRELARRESAPVDQVVA